MANQSSFVAGIPSIEEQKRLRQQYLDRLAQERQAREAQADFVSRIPTIEKQQQLKDQYQGRRAAEAAAEAAPVEPGGPLGQISGVSRDEFEARFKKAREARQKAATASELRFQELTNQFRKAFAQMMGPGYGREQAIRAGRGIRFADQGSGAKARPLRIGGLSGTFGRASDRLMQISGLNV